MTETGLRLSVDTTVSPVELRPARLSSKVSSLMAVILYFQNTLSSMPFTATATPAGAVILGSNAGIVIVQLSWSVREISLGS